jgi:hypothetical protein
VKIPSYWKSATDEQKDRVVEVAKGNSFSLGEIRLKAISEVPGGKRVMRGVFFGEEDRRKLFRNVQEAMDQADKPYLEIREMMHAIVSWRNGGPLPPDLRRCKYEKCRQIFRVRQHRSWRIYHSQKCKRTDGALKSMRAKRRAERDSQLQRVRAAWKIFRGLPDAKERTARRARVSPNFISFAIRRGELNT